MWVGVSGARMAAMERAWLTGVPPGGGASPKDTSRFEHYLRHQPHDASMHLITWCPPLPAWLIPGWHVVKWMNEDQQGVQVLPLYGITQGDFTWACVSSLGVLLLQVTWHTRLCALFAPSAPRCVSLGHPSSPGLVNSGLARG